MGIVRSACSHSSASPPRHLSEARDRIQDTSIESLENVTKLPTNVDLVNSELHD